jgi:hypothetical protein
MMKSLLITSAFLATTNLFAHVAPGNYVGRDTNNEVCSFTVGEMFFENNMQHPLTERLPVARIAFTGVKTESAIWNLGHPPVVNTELGLNRYNHDIFQQITPTKVGAVSVTLIKGDEKEDSGKPVGIIYIEDNYRNNKESKKVTCLL